MTITQCASARSRAYGHDTWTWVVIDTADSRASTTGAVRDAAGAAADTACRPPPVWWCAASRHNRGFRGLRVRCWGGRCDRWNAYCVETNPGSGGSSAGSVARGDSGADG